MKGSNRMDDTSPEIAEKMREMFQRKTPIERLKMGCSMYDTSKYLIICAILRENPKISKIDLRREIFLRFYGDDFNPEERDKIIKYLEQKTT
jgi:hypothetical protein